MQKGLQDNFQNILGRKNKVYNSEQKIRSNQLFSDPDFPGSALSVFNTSNSIFSVPQKQVFNNCSWQRPTEYFKGQPFDLYFNALNNCEIISGEIEDHYLLNAVSAICETEQRIHKVFIMKSQNYSGCYSLKVFFNGELIQIMVDDIMPFSNAQKRLALSRSAGNELWLMLIEKCWAKLNGTYENISKGSPDEIFSFLTGAPVENLYLENFDKNNLLNKILISARNKQIVSFFLKELDKNSHFQIIQDIDYNLAYHLIDAFEINVKGGKLVLLLIRNRWGMIKWKGDWSAQSTLWAPFIRKQVGSKDLEESNTFFMSFEDFIKYFDHLLICKINDNYIINSIPVKVKNQSLHTLLISFNQSTKGYISLNQFSTRLIKSFNNKYKIAFIGMFLVRIKPSPKETTYEYINGIMGKNERVTLELLEGVPSGKYLLFININWKLPFIEEVRISSYTDKVISIEEVNIQNFPQAFEKALEHCALTKGKKETFQKYGDSNIIQYTCIEQTNTNFSIILIENSSLVSTINQKIQFNQLKKASLMNPFSGNFAQLVVKPKSSQHIILKILGRKHNISFDCNFSIQEEELKGSPKKTKPPSKMDIPCDEPNYEIIEEKGEKQQVCKNQDIFLFSLQDSKGFSLLFKNKTVANNFKCMFSFKLENLEFADKALSFLVELKPGQHLLKRLNVINYTKPSSFNIKIGQPEFMPLKGEDDIIQKVLKNGKPEILKSPDGISCLKFYTFAQDNIIFWYFVNTSKTKFRGLFKFALKNLKLEMASDKEGFQWSIEIPQGGDLLRRMIIRDPKQEYSYKVSQNFRFG